MWPPNLLQNYFPSQEGMAYNQFIKMMIIFSIAFIAVLILKVNSSCPMALGGVVRLCLSATHARLLGGRGMCLLLLPPCFWLLIPALPTAAPLSPLGIFGDTPFRGSGSIKTTCIQVPGTQCITQRGSDPGKEELFCLEFESEGPGFES